MTDLDILTNLPEGLPFPEVSVTLLARAGEVSLLPDNYKSRQGDRVVSYTNFYGRTSLVDRPLTDFASEFTTAEEWLSLKGYTPLRLVTLLDVETRLAALGLNSQKLQAARGWVNELLSAFVQNPAPRNDWSDPPFDFSDVITDAAQLLTTAQP